jgi:hypothetical protein
MSSRTATFNYYYSTVVEDSDVQLLLLDCRREQRRSITITRLSSRTATLKSCVRRSSTIITRLKDEYINWWRERENDIINLGSQNSFYQSFSLLQMIAITNSKDKIRFALISKKQYVTQRARDAYVMSIYQSKASFDLFFAVQSIEVSSKNITTLNKRLQWQIDNHFRDLKYVKFDSITLQLMIFTNSFFANNRNLFSQINYVICLVDLKHVNIVHWSSIKCKRVTRSVLAAELYTLVHDFDLDVVLKATLFAIFDRFVFFVLSTDFKSLYNCLVKLDTIQKKRLMINVMSLRQLYERRKITKIKWIHDINNSIDFMIKSKAFTILKTLIDINMINMNINEWIKRSIIDKIDDQ